MEMVICPNRRKCGVSEGDCGHNLEHERTPICDWTVADELCSGCVPIWSPDEATADQFGYQTSWGAQ